MNRDLSKHKHDIERSFFFVSWQHEIFFLWKKIIFGTADWKWHVKTDLTVLFEKW